MIVKQHSKKNPANGKSPHQSIVGTKYHAKDQQGADHPIADIFYGCPNDSVWDDLSEYPKDIIEYDQSFA